MSKATLEKAAIHLKKAQNAFQQAAYEAKEARAILYSHSDFAEDEGEEINLHQQYVDADIMSNSASCCESKAYRAIAKIHYAVTGKNACTELTRLTEELGGYETES